MFLLPMTFKLYGIFLVGKTYIKGKTKVVILKSR